MTKDRLSQIIGSGADALALFSAGDRAALVTEMGSVKAARAVAFDRLPEDVRVAIVMDAGTVPEACGDAIPVAPARGPVRVFDMQAVYPKGKTGVEVKAAGWLGRKSMQRADVFDTMRVQALRKGTKLALTPAQVGMGRIYRGLVEQWDAGAVRCSSVEAMPGGSGGSREGFTDQRLSLSRRIDRLRDRVGTGTAMAIRRIRPSKRGADGVEIKRRNISDRALVDAVCLHDQDISAVLDSFGWNVDGKTVKALTLALGDALDRMIGPQRRADVLVMRPDDAGQSVWDR